MSFHDYKDTTKFDHADVVLGEVRVTFQAWQDIVMRVSEALEVPREREFIEDIMNQFNLISPHTSLGVIDEELKIYLDPEETSPDVFLLNSANAYSLYLQTVDVRIYNGVYIDSNHYVTGT